VSTNGLISLNRTLNSYTPVKFPTANPLIAPFWADADTRGIGNVYFRTTTQQMLLKNASDIINAAFSDSNFIPQHLMIVTWFEVGYFNNHADKVNFVLHNIASYS
jgi:hypothetical protein